MIVMLSHMHFFLKTMVVSFVWTLLQSPPPLVGVCTNTRIKNPFWAYSLL